MSNYVEIINKNQRHLINLDTVGFIDASDQIEELQKETEQSKPLYRTFIVIPSSFVSIKIPICGNTIEEVRQRQTDVYTKLYNAINVQQKKIRSIEV